MHELSTSLAMPQPPERVWALIGGFGSLPDWLPGVRDCVVETEGGRTERHIRLDKGETVRESLLAHNDQEHWYRYQVLEAPGVQSGTEFIATIAVKPEAGGSLVEWTARFSLPDSLPEAYVELVRERATAMYDSALANLEAVLNTGK